MCALCRIIMRRGVLLGFILLGITLCAAPAWGGPDAFKDDGYINCPVEHRLGPIEDLEVSVVPDTDDYEVSWHPLHIEGILDDNFSASVTVILQLGRVRYKQSTRLGINSVVFPGTAGQALHGKVWLALTDRSHVINDTVIQEVPPALPRPRFSAPFYYYEAENAIGDTRGRVYYVGFNHNFANGYVDTGRNAPHTPRLRVGVRHGGNYVPEDVGFDHFRLRLELVDENQDKVDQLGYDAEMVGPDPLYANKVLVLGLPGDPDIAHPGQAPFSSMPQTRHMVNPAPVMWSPAAPTAAYWGLGRTPPVIAPVKGAAVSTYPISFTSLAAAGTRALYAPLPDAMHDLPSDHLPNDGLYLLTTWAENAQNERISQNCSLLLYAMKRLEDAQLYTNVWGFDPVQGNNRHDRTADHGGPGRVVEFRLMHEECESNIDEALVRALESEAELGRIRELLKLLDPIAIATHPKRLTAGYNQSCRIRSTDQALDCSLDDLEYNRHVHSLFFCASHNPCLVAPNGSSFKEVALGHWHGCGIKATDDEIQCWGHNHPAVNNRDGYKTLNPGKVKALDVGRYHSCAIKSDDTVACWGYNGFSQVSDTPSGTFSNISSGGYHNCGVKTDQSVVCWGRNESQQSTVPANLRAVAVSAGHNHSCALPATGIPRCWGNNEYGQVSSTPSGRFTAISAGRFHTCAIRADKSIQCWGDNRYGQTSEVPTVGQWKEISAGYSHSCGRRTDNSVACWRKTDPVRPPAYKQLVAGHVDTCGIRNTDARLQCWGGVKMFEGSASTVLDGRGVYPVAFKSISLADNVLCGIRSDDRLECIAGDQSGIDIRSTDTYSAVSVGGEVRVARVCAIRKTTDTTNNTVQCWGNNTGAGKPLAVPSNLGTVSAVSVGKDYVCAIRKTTGTTNNTVRCWGNNTGAGKPLAVPSDLGTVSAVSAGEDYACAIRKTTDTTTNNTVQCWGANTGTGEALAVPSGLGKVKEVAAGLYVSHICVVKSNDEVRCWGNKLAFEGLREEWKIPMPEGLKGSDITIGFYHACVRKSDSKPVCWGWNHQNQISGPNPKPPPSWPS